MRRIIHWIARLYPAAWRQRYGVEFDSLLDDVKPGWGDVLDVLKQGFRMQFMRAKVATIAASFGILSALVAGAAASAIPDQYQVSGIIYVRTANSVAVPELMTSIACARSATKPLQGSSSVTIFIRINANPIGGTIIAPDEGRYCGSPRARAQFFSFHLPTLIDRRRRK